MAPRRPREKVATRHSLISACLLAALVGCGKEPVDTSPVGVTKRFVEAVGLRDQKAIWALLGPQTRAHLESASARARALHGEKPEVPPQDLLSPAWRSEAEPDWKPRHFRLLSTQGDHAQVEVRGSLKVEREVVTLVRENGQWKVELDLEKLIFDPPLGARPAAPLDPAPDAKPGLPVTPDPQEKPGGTQEE